MLRDPAVAGMFYEADAHALKKTLARIITEKTDKIKAIAAVSPHAGYVYSGRVAAETLSSIEIPDFLVILGPNHTGMGAPISVMARGEWRTPLGDVKINEPAADDILRLCPEAQKDTFAHTREHSIEVQLPFLQILKKSFSFVPVCVGTRDLEDLRSLAKAVAQVVKAKDGMILVSSDMTHYEPAETALRKDRFALDAIEELNEEALVKAAEKHNITMCGLYPAYTAIHAAKILGAKKGKVISYMNSGETSGDYSSVVGYAGVAII